MSKHSDNILLHLATLDKDSIIDKFNRLADTIVEQLKTEHLARLIDSATKYIPAEARDGLING